MRLQRDLRADPSRPRRRARTTRAAALPVDVSELCARLSPVEWSGLNYEYMVSYMYHIRFIGVVWSGLFAACFRLLPWYTAWRSLTEILKCKSRLLLVTSVHFALASGLRGGSQGLQGGLQGELQDILQDPPVQMLHGQETNVTRIMAHNLPTGVKISRDAKQCMCQIASEITGFVTMEASAIARDKVANGVRPNIHYSYTYYIYTLTTSHTHTDERVCSGYVYTHYGFIPLTGEPHLQGCRRLGRVRVRLPAPWPRGVLAHHPALGAGDPRRTHGQPPPAPCA